MKRTPLINRHLSALVAKLGHLDEIVIADAGLPIPHGVDVIDLSVVPGLPKFMDVVCALRTELAIEAVIWAEEASADLTSSIQLEIESWSEELGKPVACSQMAHDLFKTRTQHSTAVIRTGETTPYANIILVSGVVF